MAVNMDAYRGKWAIFVVTSLVSGMKLYVMVYVHV